MWLVPVVGVGVSSQIGDAYNGLDVRIDRTHGIIPGLTSPMI
jgi:hypothetical protein